MDLCSNSTTETDISNEICPMTTVYVRLAIDRLSAGNYLSILLKGTEPHRNVAAAIRALGHDILRDETLDEQAARYRLLVRKSAANTSASAPSA